MVEEKNAVEIREEDLEKVSGGIYEAKYIMPEGSADINQQSGGDHESGYEVKWKAEDQISIQNIDGANIYQRKDC